MMTVSYVHIIYSYNISGKQTLSYEQLRNDMRIIRRLTRAANFEYSLLYYFKVMQCYDMVIIK